MTRDFRWLNNLFKQATSKALIGWDTYLSSDEVVQELWVWYQSRPSVRDKLETLSRGESVKLVRNHVFQILKEESVSVDLFEGRSPYSSDNVKDALAGSTTNRYINDIIPLALGQLAEENDGRYAEAIRLRYFDGVVPKQGADHIRLVRAVKSLTEKVNIIAINAGLEKDKDGNLLYKQGPGSRDAVLPETRKPTGDHHADPTANIALMLIANPELRDEYLAETPLPEFLGGRGYAESS